MVVAVCLLQTYDCNLRLIQPFLPNGGKNGPNRGIFVIFDSGINARLVYPILGLPPGAGADLSRANNAEAGA
jgi:hypothetical protein